MGSILVCGVGMVGLSAAMMLARDGHQVTVLEADPDLVPATPAAAWESWQRKGVTQFRQPHNLFPRFRQVCDEELPGLSAACWRPAASWPTRWQSCRRRSRTASHGQGIPRSRRRRQVTRTWHQLRPVGSRRTKLTGPLRCRDTL